MPSALDVSMYNPSAAGRNNTSTVNMIGIKYVIIFCCIGSIPCCGTRRCWSTMKTPYTSGRMKNLSGAERSESHKNFSWYISTAVWSVAHMAHQIGSCTSCGKHPPSGFTPCFRYSSIIAIWRAWASSGNFLLSASISGLIRRIAIVV